MSPINAASMDGVVETDILQRLTLTQVSGLNFGMILPGNTPGSVDIARNNGACTAQGGVTLIGTHCQRGEFLITGPARQQVLVTTDAAPILLTRQGGGATLTMDRIQINNNWNQRLDAAGEHNFFVAGRLQVPANQTPGVYEGTFNVTVDYR